MLSTCCPSCVDLAEFQNHIYYSELSAVVLCRYMDLWPCTDNDRHYLQHLLGLGTGPSAGGAVASQAPVQAQVPPSPPAAPRQLPAPSQPPVLVPPPGPPQPITQIPRELGNLINALPPVHVSVTSLRLDQYLIMH